MGQLADEQRQLLSDGRWIVIRRLTPADSPGLAQAFARLSAETRRLRFLSPKSHLTEGELRYLTDVDGHDHEALVAIDPLTRRGVGIARFVREAEDPYRAEIAVTVSDDWQRHGVATALLSRLSARAREEGVASFTALVAPENHTMQELLARIGSSLRVLGTSEGAVEYAVDVAPAGVGEQLREALRATAAGRVRLPAQLSRELRALMPR